MNYVDLDTADLKTLKILFFFRKSFKFPSLKIGELFGKHSDPKTQASFVFFSSAIVLWEFRETFAEEFCNFDGRMFCISAMI